MRGEGEKSNYRCATQFMTLFWPCSSLLRHGSDGDCGHPDRTEAGITRQRAAEAAAAREIPDCYPLPASDQLPHLGRIGVQKKKIKKLAACGSIVGRTGVQKKYRSVSCMWLQRTRLHVSGEAGRAARRTRGDAKTG
jgi:hypothetical protein